MPALTAERIDQALVQAATRLLARGQAPVVQSPIDLARRCGIEPDPWQADVLTSTAQQIILCCSRQVGKSQTVALKALSTALGSPGTLVLILSPGIRQSSEMMRKIQAGFHALGRDAAVDADQESALQLTLDNQSRIVALPGKQDTIRGYSGVNLLVIDEAAFVRDELYLAVRPMLAVSGGSIILLSTPFGKRGFFYDEWENGAGWERHQVTADLCPRLPPEFLDGERRKGLTYFEREFMCVFHEADSAAFTEAEIAAAYAESVEEWGL